MMLYKMIINIFNIFSRIFIFFFRNINTLLNYPSIF